MNANASVALVSLVFLLSAVVQAAPPAARTIALTQLQQSTDIHSIAVSRGDPAHLYLATRNGLFLLAPDGWAAPLSADRDDFTGFAPHPNDASLFYASGRPLGGGNLGVIMSTDGGRTWRQIATGVNGPVCFQQMVVSKADPKTIYGVFDGLQVSKDGGHTWRIVGSAPEGLMALAASSKRVERLYAATKQGLLITFDQGRVWQSAYVFREPATTVVTASDGHVYAFVVGTGLLRGMEPNLRWVLLYADRGNQYILHLAVDPTNADKLYAVTRAGTLQTSKDGGRTWTAYGLR
jgi:photosystem II stability/assembly factor-like uncharacterized protein